MRTIAIAVAGAIAFTGCSGSDGGGPAAVQPAAPNTGFFAFATVGGQPRVYMPSAHPSSLAVVNAGAANGTSGVVSYVDLGTDAQPIAVGADGDDVVVADGGNPVVYFLSASSGAVRGTASLPSGSAPYQVSGNNLYSTGVAVDSARRRAWLSVSTGLAEFDLDAFAATRSIDTPATENFAYDPGARKIYAPFYLCDPSVVEPVCRPYPPDVAPPITDSVAVVDLVPDVAVSYLLQDPSAQVPRAPLGFEMDAVALDTSLGIAAAIAEEPPTLQVLDLGSSTFDAQAGTCRIPSGVTIALPSQKFSAVTADPNTHLAVVAQEAGDGLAFVDLSAAKQGAASTLVFAMPDLPDGSPWVTRVDPHGIGVGVVGGRSYAFLVHDDRTWIARVDLGLVATLGLQSGAAFASAVSYVSVPPPP